jgi:isocitrate lyase
MMECCLKCRSFNTHELGVEPEMNAASLTHNFWVYRCDNCKAKFIEDREMAQDNEFKTDIYDKMTLNQLVETMAHLEAQKDSLAATVKDVNLRLDFLRLGKIPEKMDEEGVTGLTLEGIGRVSLTADAYVSIKAGQKEAAWEWLRDTGHGDLITETINASTLKAAIKEMVKKGEEIPNEMINFSPFTRASITRKGVVSGDEF